jgi:RNA polymerase sigma-70 factor (ECF subfamily)
MPNAQDMVVEQLPSLRRYAASLSRNATRAEDLVQDTVERALTRLHQWQAGSDIRAWLLSIMHSQHVNFVRRAVREQGRMTRDATPIVAVSGNQELSIELSELRWALDQLPKDIRETICLVALKGLTCEEAARTLCVPMGTVQSRLCRGRRRLHALLEAE